MEQRRILLFLLFSMAIIIGWSRFVIPVLAPRPEPNAQQQVGADGEAAQDAEAEAEAAGAEQADAPQGGADTPPQVANADAADETDEGGDEPAGEPAAATLPNHPAQTVMLGSDDPDSGFFLAVVLDSQGAAVRSITFNDPRYCELDDRSKPLTIIGRDTKVWQPERLYLGLLISDGPEPIVVRVAEESPAAMAGVLPQDRLLEINDELVNGLDDVREVLKPLTTGDNVQLTVDRDGRDVVIDAQLTEPLTFGTHFYPIENQLQALNSDTSLIHWELVETERLGGAADGPVSKAVFRLRAPDDNCEVIKTYWLEHVAGTPEEIRSARDTNPAGYQIMCEIAIHNLTDAPLRTRYVLQGPVGVPLENRENARKLRDFKVGTFEEDGDFDSSTITAETLVEAEAENDFEYWTAPLRYVGLDTQYFSVLVVPQELQVETPYTTTVRPMVLQEDPDEENWSEISAQLESVDLRLLAGQEQSHVYKLYAGPKRQALLEPISQIKDINQETETAIPVGVDEVLDYGMFGFIAKAMLWLLNSLHSIDIPYAVAIICLTIIVRGCMFPLSRKQAISAQKMKELQPEINKLKDKYGKDKEKLAKAQMELFSKHNYNPFAGCLPIFLQLPIFIGLYTALNASVDLRMAPFLYIDNLAAPDALVPNFLGGIALPFLGRDLNLLPLIVVVLFIAQQKMFMPPPADEQAALQQKMMSYMMIFFGFMFYRMPAGLCLYFIASSLWGMGERKLLDLQKASAQSDDSGGETKSESKPMLAAALSRVANVAGAAGNGSPSQRSNKGSGGSSRSGSSKKRRSRR